jgi:hypothetical protein
LRSRPHLKNAFAGDSGLNDLDHSLGRKHPLFVADLPPICRQTGSTSMAGLLLLRFAFAAEIELFEEATDGSRFC